MPEAVVVPGHPDLEMLDVGAPLKQRYKVSRTQWENLETGKTGLVQPNSRVRVREFSIPVDQFIELIY